MKRILLSTIAPASLLTTLAVAQLRSIPAADDARVFGRAGGHPVSSRMNAHPAPPGTGASKSVERNLLIYVLTVAPGAPAGTAFGVVDVGSGAFLPIGPGLPSDVGAGLVRGRGTSLLTLTFNSLLDAIDPVTGSTSVIGTTGLRDCSTIGAYDPLCANVIGRLDGTVYLTDFAQNLYSVDQVTGAARLIGPTGIAAVPFAPGSQNVHNGECTHGLRRPALEQRG